MDPHLSTAAVDRQVYNNDLRQALRHRRQVRHRPPARAVVGRSSPAASSTCSSFARGVKFHDGSDFNADIVKWNFDRMREPALASPGRAEIAPVKDVKVVDPFTVEITLSAPFAPFLSVLTDRAGTDGLEGRGGEVQGRLRAQSGGHRPVPLRGVGEGRSTSPSSASTATGRRACPTSDEVIYRPIPDPPCASPPCGPDRWTSCTRSLPKDVAPAKGRRGLQVSEIPSLLVAGHAPQQPGGALHQQGHPPGDVVRGGPAGDPAGGLPGPRLARLEPVPPSMWAQDADFTDWRRDPPRPRPSSPRVGCPAASPSRVKSLPAQVQELQITQAQLKEIGIDMKIEHARSSASSSPTSAATTSWPCASAGQGGPIPTERDSFTALRAAGSTASGTAIPKVD